MDQDEQAIIARAKAGDKSAFEHLIQSAVRPATQLAYAMLHDRAEAEDAFQESALRAWRRLENLRAGARFEPWFMGIVSNQCRDVRRGRWLQLVRLPEPSGTFAIDETGWLEGEDLRRVDQLPFDKYSELRGSDSCGVLLGVEEVTSLCPYPVQSFRDRTVVLVPEGSSDFD